MKVIMIGTGYVGLVSGACFADTGLNVCCIDIDQAKIERLKQGIIPIYEPGLEDIVKRNVAKKRLTFSTSLAEEIVNAHVVFIAVGTPMGDDGSADLSAVLAVAKNIGQTMTQSLIVVDKSTVPIGTAEHVTQVILQTLSTRFEKEKQPYFEVVSNPEFLKEGSAITDFIHPDRVVIGCETQHAKEVMTQLYASFMLKSDRMIFMDVKSAEMTKYAANCMLATKISFINEMANICEKVGADITKVRAGICSDSRIGNAFLYPGCGYGGSCFPKDVSALIKTAASYHVSTPLITAVDDVNTAQKLKIPTQILKRFGDVKGRVFAIWGLAFKPNTDDMRDAPALNTVAILSQHGAILKVYDPVAMDVAQKEYFHAFNNIIYCNDMYEALEEAQALILHTEWSEFRAPIFEEMRVRMKQKIIFDGRNLFTKSIPEDFEYHCIGRK